MELQSDIKTIHEYWKNPDDMNNPYLYLRGQMKTNFLKSVINRYVDKSDHILEIGCNIGRNLNGLYLQGFCNLSGIEINKSAISLMKYFYPYMYYDIDIFSGPVEKKLKHFKTDSIDCIYTMAVLEHIHKDSEKFVFNKIKEIANKYIIIIEDEVKVSNRHFKRNYYNVFSDDSFKQVEYMDCKGIKRLGKNYKLRVF